VRGLQSVARENNVNVHPHYEIFNGFLIFLLILHAYWCARQAACCGSSACSVPSFLLPGSNMCQGQGQVCKLSCSTHQSADGTHTDLRRVNGVAAVELCAPLPAGRGSS